MTWTVHLKSCQRARLNQSPTKGKRSGCKRRRSTYKVSQEPKIVSPSQHVSYLSLDCRAANEPGQGSHVRCHILVDKIWTALLIFQRQLLHEAQQPRYRPTRMTESPGRTCLSRQPRKLPWKQQCLTAGKGAYTCQLAALVA